MKNNKKIILLVCLISVIINANKIKALNSLPTMSSLGNWNPNLLVLDTVTSAENDSSNKENSCYAVDVINENNTQLSGDKIKKIEVDANGEIKENTSNGQQQNYQLDPRYNWTFELPANPEVYFSDISGVNGIVHKKMNSGCNGISCSDVYDVKAYSNSNTNNSCYVLQADGYTVQKKDGDAWNSCNDKIYAIYKNVGVYEGKQVDLRVVVTGWKKGYTYENGKYSQKNNTSYQISLYKNRVQVGLDGLRYVSLRYEFINSAGEPLQIRGNGTLTDLDYSQAFKFGETIQKAYIYSGMNICTNFSNDNCAGGWEQKTHLFANNLNNDTNFTLKDSNYVADAIQASNYGTTSNYKYAWSTILFKGSYFELTFYIGEPRFLDASTPFGGGMFVFEPGKMVVAKCNPKIIYRSINVNNAFLNKDGNPRYTGKNWCENNTYSKKMCKFDNEIVKTYITDRPTSNGFKNANSNEKVEPLYSFEIGPDNIKKIRKYNKDNPSYDKCVKDEFGHCKSTFMENIKRNGYVNEISGSCIDGDADGKYCDVDAIISKEGDNR